MFHLPSWAATFFKVVPIYIQYTFYMTHITHSIPPRTTEIGGHTLHLLCTYMCNQWKNRNRGTYITLIMSKT